MYNVYNHFEEFRYDSLSLSTVYVKLAYKKQRQ